MTPLLFTAAILTATAIGIWCGYRIGYTLGQLDAAREHGRRLDGVMGPMGPHA